MYMPSLHNIHESHCPSPPRACLLPRSQTFPTLFLIAVLAYCKWSKLEAEKAWEWGFTSQQCRQKNHLLPTNQSAEVSRNFVLQFLRLYLVNLSGISIMLSVCRTSEMANKATTMQPKTEVWNRDHTLPMSPRSHRELWTKSTIVNNYSHVNFSHLCFFYVPYFGFFYEIIQHNVHRLLLLSSCRMQYNAHIVYLVYTWNPTQNVFLAIL